MPKESLNVYFSIIDGGSATLRKLTDKEWRAAKKPPPGEGAAGSQ